MDKNTVIGLGLIGAILIAFSVLNKPSEKELKNQREKAKQELKSEEKQIVAEESKDTASVATIGDTAKKSIQPIVKEGFAQFENNSSGFITTLENKLIKVDFNSRGGKVADVWIKPYESYAGFQDKKTHTPLQLIDNEGSQMGLTFNYKGKEISTEKYEFKVANSSKTSITYRIEPEAGKYIDLIYSLADSSYDVQFNVAFFGFSGEIDPQSVFLDLGIQFLISEKQASQQRMISTIFFETQDGYDYLSEHSDDEGTLEEYPANWVAFKQSYFSAILTPEDNFPKKGTSFSVKTYKPESKYYNKYIKKYRAKINLGMNSTADGKANLSWYFGPNDYDVLSSYGKNYEDIVNLGWGLFRWVNIYMIQPIYVLLVKIGLGAGIAILVLTMLVKLILTPVTWKMYVSSAKMRILKPQIDELNQKYPKKEDGMKKQMEMMALYRESGASPLSGCLPMLIQMPILFAVFRFFPSDFGLRQQGFLWAEDLSTFDSIYTWDAHIPLLSSIYGNHISLFTLLMAITTLIYTHVNSGNMQQPQQPGMPNMKVIMYIFPVMMIFFFNNYSAGLSYYYFISTLMSILIMYAIKFFFVDEEKLKAKMELKKAEAVKKAGGKPKKSKFQERLETMQQQQQERLKGKK